MHMYEFSFKVHIILKMWILARKLFQLPTCHQYDICVCNTDVMSVNGGYLSILVNNSMQYSV